MGIPFVNTTVTSSSKSNNSNWFLIALIGNQKPITPSALIDFSLRNYYIVYRGFITSCKEDLSVKRHLAVTNVSLIFIHTMEHDQRLNGILTH